MREIERVERGCVCWGGGGGGGESECSSERFKKKNTLKIAGPPIPH